MTAVTWDHVGARLYVARDGAWRLVGHLNATKTRIDTWDVELWREGQRVRVSSGWKTLRAAKARVDYLVRNGKVEELR